MIDHDFANGYAACHFTRGINYEGSGSTACSLLITIPIIAVFLYAAPFHTVVVLLIVLAARTKKTETKQIDVIENVPEPMVPPERIEVSAPTVETESNSFVRPNVLDGML